MTGLRGQAELGTRSILLYVRTPEPRKHTVLGPTGSASSPVRQNGRDARRAELGTRSILLYVRTPEPRATPQTGRYHAPDYHAPAPSVIYINQIKILVKSQLQPISQLHFDSSVAFLDFDELDIREIAAYVIFDLGRDKFRVQGGITAVNFFPFTVTSKLDLGSLGENDFV